MLLKFQMKQNSRYRVFYLPYQFLLKTIFEFSIKFFCKEVDNLKEHNRGNAGILLWKIFHLRIWRNELKLLLNAPFESNEFSFGIIILQFLTEGLMNRDFRIFLGKDENNHRVLRKLSKLKFVQKFLLKMMGNYQRFNFLFLKGRDDVYAWTFLMITYIPIDVVKTNAREYRIKFLKFAHVNKDLNIAGANVRLFSFLRAIDADQKNLKFLVLPMLYSSYKLKPSSLEKKRTEDFVERC
jgi:hypothetical protein